VAHNSSETRGLKVKKFNHTGHKGTRRKVKLSSFFAGVAQCS
jgi:hypothetical protein